MQPTVANLKQALREARAHVYRQQHAPKGKHAQDQVEAKAWLEKYGDLMSQIGYAP